MTLHITTGRVVFKRSVQPAQYESKSAEVELTFAIPEGDELGDTLDRVAAAAQAKALEMVGLKEGPKTPAKQVEVKETKTEPKTPPKSTVPATGKGRTKADLEKEQKDKLNGAAEMVEEPKANISTGGERVDPAQVAEDDFSALLTGETVEQVTDEQLLSKVSQHNAKIKNPAAIKQLIAKQFDKPEGKQLKDIPQEKRAAFLEALVKI